MLAVDTNIFVRFLIDDDAAQSAVAKNLMERENLFVSLTVFLEAEWVLRHVYRLKAPAIVASFRKLAGLPQLMPENPPALFEALNWMEAGMDFADALHLIRAAQCEAFVTFDRKLAKTARRLTSLAVRVPD